METKIITGSTAENEAPVRFVIEPSEVSEMMKELGLSSVMELLPTLLPAVKRMARAPISSYQVGAAGLGESGRIYLGVNLEFPGLPLHHSVHAEQFMICNAVAHKERAIRCIAVSSAPCGHCRQFLQEIRNASEILILITGSGFGSDFRPLSSFIPEPFGPPDLLLDDEPLLLEPHDNRIEIIEQWDGIKGAARRVRDARRSSCSSFDSRAMHGGRLPEKRFMPASNMVKSLRWQISCGISPEKLLPEIRS